MAEIISNPSYELSSLRLVPLVAVTLSAAMAERSDIIPSSHTTNSLVLASGVAAGIAVNYGMYAMLCSDRRPEISQGQRRRISRVTAVGAAAVVTALNPEIRQEKSFSSHEAGAVALDALGGGVLAGALTFAVWRKSRKAGK